MQDFVRMPNAGYLHDGPFGNELRNAVKRRDISDNHKKMKLQSIISKIDNISPIESPINPPKMLLTPENEPKKKISVIKKSKIYTKASSNYNSRYSPISPNFPNAPSNKEEVTDKKIIRNQSSCLPKVKQRELKGVNSLYYSSSPMNRKKWGIENSRLIMPKSTTSAKLFRIMQKRGQNIKSHQRMPEIIPSSKIYGGFKSKAKLNASNSDISPHNLILKGNKKGIIDSNIFITKSNYKSFDNKNNLDDVKFCDFNIQAKLFSDKNLGKLSDEEDVEYTMSPKLGIKKAVYNQDSAHTFVYHSRNEPSKKSDSDCFSTQNARKGQKKPPKLSLKPLNNAFITKNFHEKHLLNSRKSVLIKNKSKKPVPKGVRKWFKHFSKFPRKSILTKEYASEQIHKLVQRYKSEG
ncbi:unnamed protein product [Moneuplotes crassus]|uniref:Uncharacterized protein n=1 Tax=Euplotes crassus TaxID=5936 RepID=A0AAD1U9G9_EUPCR|nr:unnamed protein product [Moneuplotes crassus]